jgi:alkanesulfonate monooxygenase SsuD/methylene tetrahydromethanopterin reductase-like flavin-dependent oxidoreductase (luciferase family)
MEFGLLTEANLQSGDKFLSFHERYQHVLEEVVLADKVGFDVFGSSEQHFFAPHCVISSPETILAAAAVLTENIKLRFASILLPFHHPIDSAEKISSVDVLSNGRVEFGTAKGNSWNTLGGYNLDPNEVDGRFDEAFKIILQALTNEKFKYEGKFWTIPEERSLSPKLIQKDHPPLWYAAISPKSHKLAGEMGCGLMTLTVGVELEQLAQRVQTYREGIKSAKPVGNYINNKVSSFTNLHCAETTQRALDYSEKPFMDYTKTVVDLYEEKLKKTGVDVDFSSTREKLRWDYLNDSNQVIVGNPDEIIEKLEKYEEAGVDEIFIRSEGIDHPEVMKSIELLGKYVIPHFKEKKKKQEKEKQLKGSF